MKRFLALFLSVLMLVPCFNFTTFAEVEKNLHFELSTDDEKVIYVEAGDEIVVDFYATNIDDGSDFTISNLQNEIEYDTSFFEFTEGDVDLEKATSSRLAVYSWGAHRVQILALHTSGGKPETYSNKQLVASVTFKVKDGLADGTTGKLINKVCIASDSINGVKYTISNEGMTVIIGRAPVETHTVKYVDGDKTVFTDSSVVAGSDVTLYSAISQTDKKFVGWKAPDGTVYQPGDKYTVEEDTTFTAVWLNKVTLKFDTNGGSELADKTYWENDVVDLDDFVTTRENYTFDGWYSDAQLKNKVESIKLTTDTTVYAGWTAVPAYTLNFVTNCEETIEEVTALQGKTIDLSSYVPSKEGYTFAGWYSDSQFGTKVTSVVMNGNKTVYAKWDIKQFKITFSVDGGTAVSPVTVDYKTVVDLRNYETERLSYEFDGWFLDAEFTQKAERIQIVENITVYAKWVKLYTLSFNSDGGTQYPAVTAKENTVVDLTPYAPEKADHIFGGWYTEAQYTNLVSSVNLTGNVVVYAKWIKKEVPVFTLNFVTNGGNSINEVSAEKGTVIDLAGYVPERYGYTFGGWYSDSDLDEKVTSVTMDGNKTVYADWTINKYKVTFDVNGGEAISPVNVNYLAVVDLSQYEPERDGYVFGGWYLDSLLTQRVEEIEVIENVTVYAKWTKLYTLAFNSNGGTQYQSVTAKENTVVDLTPYTPEKADYIFGGWYTDAQLTNAVSSVTLTSNVTVFAKWIKKEDPVFTLTFVTNGGNDINAVVAVKDSEIILSGYVPARDKYEFDGWYSNASLTNKVTSVTLTEDKTVYAKWIPLYTLTFVTNTSSYLDEVVAKKGTVIDLAEYELTRLGYTFDGWFLDYDFENEAQQITLNKDVTVYAKWIRKNQVPVEVVVEKVTVTFVSYDDNGNKITEKEEYPKNYTVDYSKIVPEREGYIFDGWYNDEGFTEKATKVKLTESTTVYAKWIPIDESEDDDENKGSTKPAILTDSYYAYIIGDEGYVRPKSNITRAEAATIFFRLLKDEVRNEALTTENVFEDVNEGHWFNTAVSTLANLGIVNGRTTETYAPNEPITRAELTTIVARMTEAKYEGKSMFDDISGHWAEGYINLAASIGWVEGDGDGKFRPNDKITRAEVMTLINRVLDRVPETMEDLHKDMKVWPDNADTNAWYYIAVQAATHSFECEKKADGVHIKITKIIDNFDWTIYE